MTIKELAQTPRFEPRWPVALSILAVIVILALLPGRIKLLPSWFPYVIGGVVLAPIIAAGVTKGSASWLRAERTVTLLFVLIVGVGNLTSLASLILMMVQRSTELGGLQLFASSIAVWVTNLLSFSLLYWQIDRGGPDARMNEAGIRPDWLFPQEDLPTEVVPPGWRPTFIDYLFLGYSTATAFSTTDVIPLTSRAKLLMMLDSTISLLTLVIVAARAINIMG